MIGKEHASIEFEEWSNVSAGCENPLQPERVESGAVHRVCRLEHNKRWHRIYRDLKAAAKKPRPMRSASESTRSGRPRSTRSYL